MQPDLQYLVAGIALVYFLWASISDFRHRTIPDYLNYGALVAALLVAAISGSFSLPYAVFVALAFAFAYLLYRLGAWAGGDVKFFTSASAFFALLVPGFSPWQLVAAFMASALLSLPVAFILFGKRVWGNRKRLGPVGVQSIKAGLWAAGFSGISASVYVLWGIAGLAAAVVAGLVLARSKWAFALACIAALVFGQVAFAYGAAAGGALGLVSTFLFTGFGALAPVVLRRSVPTGELEEGDIPFQSVYVDKVTGKVSYWSPPSVNDLVAKAVQLDTTGLASSTPPEGALISCLDAGGLSDSQISELKKVKGVTHLVVKESLPFAPAIAIGFILVGLLVR